MLREYSAAFWANQRLDHGFGVRYSDTTFGIFEAFPNIAGREQLEH
jgi:hypothetical protein